MASLTPNSNLAPDYQTRQEITYTHFNKVETITANEHFLELTYGLDQQRISQKLYEINRSNKRFILEKQFIAGVVEKVIFADQTTKTINYITSPEGLTAIEITANPGEREWYWVFTDHLGSITTLLRESDGQKFEMSFDAWGNRRDSATWENYTTTFPDFVIDRGFTGHEHLDVFGLINMNGRVYDPVVARFLSPDPYIQAPGMPQNYNGYVYALNNPLVYTDPSGEIIFTIVGALLAPVTGGASLAIGIAMDVGGAINLGIKASQGQINTFGDGLAAYGIGAAAGAAGYFTGGAAFAAAGGAAGGAGGFLAGAAAGAAGSAAAMPIQSLGNTLYFGDPFITPEQYALGILTGAALGGTVNGTIAAANGKTFWNGSVKPGNVPTPTTTPTPYKTPNQKGQEGVQKAIDDFQAEGGIVKQTEVTLEVNGTRIRVDIVGEFEGKITFIEVKNGVSAGYTPNQTIALPKMIDGIPVTPVGGNAANAGLIPGQTITKTQYILIIKKY
ncbi:MAG: RHS repeat-associated core domain-containing protein [Lentimicrobiaceae bacterium]|nr:RHS repeat-associated core domain-containing protein [Lentimicrobiaceae bacterium]